MFKVYVQVYRYVCDNEFWDDPYKKYDHTAEHVIEAKNAEDAMDKVGDYYFDRHIPWHTNLVTEFAPDVLDCNENPCWIPVWQETTSYDW